MIETNRLILKPHLISNTQSLYKILDDIKNMSFYQKPFSLKIIKNLIKQYFKLYNEKKWISNK